MSAIQMIWYEKRREGLQKQGEFKYGYCTYFVEYHQNGGVTISNRSDTSQMRFKCDPKMLYAIGGGVIKINGTGFDDSRSKLVYYFTERDRVKASDVQTMIHCETAAAETIVSEILVVA